MSFDVPDVCALPTAEVGTARMLAAAEDLGLGSETLATLTATWRDGDCSAAQQHLEAAVTARLDQVQAEIADRNRQAAEAGPGTAAWATELAGSASLAKNAARLQAVSAALTTAT